MTKSFLTIALLIFFVSCGKSGGGGGNGNSGAAATTISSERELSDTTAEVPNDALTFDADVKMLGFTRTQEDKVLDAVDLIKKVVASDEFKNRVLNHVFQGKKTFEDNKGLTNSQIYQRILEGAEKLNPDKNNSMDVELELYRESANTVGYTLPSVNKIWMNTKYFNSFNPVDVTGNLFHEWLHKIGFGHAVERTPTRSYSVPYAIGYIVKELSKKYY